MTRDDVPVVRFTFVEGADPTVPLPAYETSGAAGMDIRANFQDRSSPVYIGPGERGLITTGLRLEMPATLEAQVRPRSGMALKQGLTVANAPGTIDSDYRGEVGVILINLGQEPVTISHGDRVAQMVFAPVTQVKVELAECLSETTRGAGGFGSTGTK